MKAGNKQRYLPLHRVPSSFFICLGIDLGYSCILTKLHSLRLRNLILKTQTKQNE